VAEEIARLSAELAERMRELRAEPTDPRLAPLFTQLQALMRAHVAAAAAANAPAVPPVNYSFDLPPELAAPLREYLEGVPPFAFAQAPALSESDAGRRILELAPPDRIRIAVAAYSAWSSERWGGPKGGGLRRVVSDLLRARLPLADADAIALAEAGAREGFTYSSYSPNQAVLGAIDRHVAAHGLSPACVVRSNGC
jgi:hypothetical protein